MTESEPPDGPDIAIAVVDAETPGNVGTIARAMKNFGLSELLLVDPPELDPDGEAYGFAGRAREDVLPSATEITFEDLVTNYHTVGTTATTNEDATSHVRYPAIEAEDLADHLREVDASTAIVFGRERVGLTNEELAEMDEVCSIPASAAYPSLNLGQATSAPTSPKSSASTTSSLAFSTRSVTPNPSETNLGGCSAACSDARTRPRGRRARCRESSGRAHSVRTPPTARSPPAGPTRTTTSSYSTCSQSQATASRKPSPKLSSVT